VELNFERRFLDLTDSLIFQEVQEKIFAFFPPLILLKIILIWEIFQREEKLKIAHF